MSNIGSIQEDMNKEIIPGLTFAELDKMMGVALAQADGNKPQTRQVKNGFLDILKNGKSEISSSSVFIRKVAF